MVKIQFRATPEQRDRWDDFVAENGHVDSRADLIRLAVEEHIADKEESGSGDLNPAALDDMQDGLDDLLTHIRETKSAITSLRETTASEADVEEITRNIVRETILRVSNADDVEIDDDPEYGVVVHHDLGGMTQTERGHQNTVSGMGGGVATTDDSDTEPTDTSESILETQAEEFAEEFFFGGDGYPHKADAIRGLDNHELRGILREFSEAELHDIFGDVISVDDPDGEQENTGK